MLWERRSKIETNAKEFKRHNIFVCVHTDTWYKEMLACTWSFRTSSATNTNPTKQICDLNTTQAP